MCVCVCVEFLSTFGSILISVLLRSLIGILVTFSARKNRGERFLGRKKHSHEKKDIKPAEGDIGNRGDGHWSINPFMIDFTVLWDDGGFLLILHH